MKQGYSDRKDESLGMKDGKESSKSQSYKGRRDESYAMKNNEKYMPKSMSSKVMGHASAPKACPVSVGEGLKEVKPAKQGMKGYSKQAFDYKHQV